MKNLIIIGAGGLGRSLFAIAQNCIGYGEEFLIKGFLDDNKNALDGFHGYPRIIGDIASYKFEEDDVFISSIGSKEKKRICKEIQGRNGEFYTLISKSAIIYPNVKIGKGSIILDFVSIGSDAEIGEHSLIQAYAVIGHDSKIGNYVRIDCHVVCVGGVIINDNVNIHTSAVISHNVVVGENANVGALSFVIRKVKANTTVYGNPARTLIV